MRFTKIFRCAICIGSFMLNGISGKAQLKDGMAKQDYLPASPDAAALGKFGDVPVNLNTGTPNISVPIYELKEGNISLPIGLSYNASGIKVQEEATIVGLGWSLNAGGVITRIVRGIADEAAIGFFYQRDTIKKLLANQYDPYEASRKKYSIVKGQLDSEPDLFICNIGGLTFKFAMNMEGKFETIPVSNYKISYSQANKNDNATGVWNITDDQGNGYSFGGKINAPVPFYLVERVRRLEATDKNDPTAWFINYIKPSSFSSQSPSLIQFEYQPNLQRPPVYYIESKYRAAGSGNSIIPIPKDETIAQLHEIQTVILQKITYSQGEIRFITVKDRTDNLSLHKLNSIAIYSKDLALIKSCNLSYTYFNNTIAGNTRRLKLVAVTMGAENITQDITGEIISPQKYQFEYNNGLLPEINSKDQDHWGYYNASGNTTLIPTVKVFNPAAAGIVTYTSTGTRDINPEKISMGILTKITYPTGGSSEFEFEPNTENNVDLNTRLVNQPRDANGNFYCGGLRIKRITTTDPYHPDKKNIKVYEYDENGVSSGKISDFPVYAFFQDRGVLYYECCEFLADTCFRYCVQNLPNSGYIVIKQNSQFNLIGNSNSVFYTNITVRNGENGEFGQEQYNYSYMQPTVSEKNFNLPFSAIWQPFWKSNLASEKKFKATTPGYAPISEKDYAYNNIRYSSEVKGFKVAISRLFQVYKQNLSAPYEPILLTETPEEQYYIEDRETFFSDFTYQSGQTEKNYSSDNNFIINTSSQTEIDPISLQPKSVKSVNSEGQTEEVRRKFAGNYTLPQVTGTDPYPLQGMANLQARNIAGAVVEETKLLNGNVTGSVLNVYDIAIPRVVKAYTTESVTPIPERQFVFSDIQGRNIQFDARYKELIEFIQYDNAGNPLLQKYKDGHAVAVLWDYNNSLPTAEIKLGNPEKDVFIKQFSDPRNNIFKYNFAYTSFEGTNNGNWNGVNSGGITQAMAPMGKYVYDIGKGKISYSYDPQSRGQLNDYYLYYWKHPQAVINVASNAGSQTQEILFTNNDGWQLIRHTLKQGYSVTVSGTGFIDELRLFTTDSRISTVAYIPGLGVQCQADENGRLQYYFYDDFARLAYIKDMEGNILKTFDYQFQK